MHIHLPGLDCERIIDVFKAQGTCQVAGCKRCSPPPAGGAKSAPLNP